MVYYTQFSRDTTSSESKKLWDPSKTLGIINMASGYECITCIGHAPSKRRRCQNPIRKDNKEFIMQTLSDIAYLRPDSPAVLSRLREIVGPALCVRYHQNQADTVIASWQSTLQQLKPQLQEPKTAKSIQSGGTKVVIKDECIEDLRAQLREMRELLAEVQAAKSRQCQDEESKQGEERATNDRNEEKRKRQEKDREAKKQEKERLEKERLEKERLEKERQEKERLEKERKEKEEKERREREHAAQNERIRQRAQKLREEREREKREREQKEQKEWNQSWKKYEERWTQFRASGCGGKSIKDDIPWPVKSGLYRDVTASSVKEFLQRSGETEGNMSRLMRKECQKWHPDMINRFLSAFQVTDADQLMLGMICRVVTDLLNSSAGKSAEFF